MICHKVFVEEDDIVVCPDCGTPYHRECYQSEGHCINTVLHKAGESWSALENEHRQKSGGVECPQCHHVNRPGAVECESCRLPLKETDSVMSGRNMSDDRGVLFSGDGYRFFNANDPCCGMPPESDMGGESLGDVAAFVRTNTLYYIPLFKRFKDTGKKASLNLPCILFPYFYFANRKMWLMAILTGIISIICGLPNMLLSLLTTLTTDDFMEMLQSAYGADMGQIFTNVTAFLQTHESLLNTLNVPFYAAGLGIRLLLCIFGNYLYFRHVLKSVKKIRKRTATPQLRAALLSSEGGTNFWNVIGCIGLYYAAVLAIYGILFLLVS
jgi:hypothetical protein